MSSGTNLPLLICEYLLNAGLILGLHPAIEKCSYKVTLLGASLESALLEWSGRWLELACAIYMFILHVVCLIKILKIIYSSINFIICLMFHFRSSVGYVMMSSASRGIKYPDCCIVGTPSVTNVWHDYSCMAGHYSARLTASRLKSGTLVFGDWRRTLLSLNCWRSWLIPVQNLCCSGILIHWKKRKRYAEN